MPIYDFKCGSCAYLFEHLVKLNESTNCPACGSSSVERLFSPTASVSTGKTRERSLAGARSKAGAVKREKDHAHSQYLSNHIKDHS